MKVQMGRSVREVRFYEDYVEFELTKGYYAKVSLEDWERVKDRSWQVAIRGASTYATSSKRINGKQTSVYLHRFLFDDINGVIDHLNGDGLDNRRENLRVTDYSTNIINYRPQKRSNKTGFAGVYKHPRDTEKPYYVQVVKYGQVYTAGEYFGTAEEAARARDELAIALYGEHIFLNFPSDPETRP